MEDARGNVRHMHGFLKNWFVINKVTSLAVVLLYVFVVSAVSLFHNDGCELKPSDVAHKDVISRNDPCPACAFLAGHSSTGANHGPALVRGGFLLASQFLAPVTVLQHNEWAYSIISRAPPSTAIS